VGRGDGSLSRYASRTRSPTGIEIGPAMGLPDLKNSSGLNLIGTYVLVADSDCIAAGKHKDQSMS
ncbi:hypothetical protein A2U01_0089714, partial [Trifolium medium]|nr:hypothetical protein [Trifolium medium]